MCFLLVTSGIIQLLNMDFAVIFTACYLFILLTTYIDYSSITSWRVLCKVLNVAAIGSLYKYCLYDHSDHFGCFLTPSVVNMKPFPWLHYRIHSHSQLGCPVGVGWSVVGWRVLGKPWDRLSLRCLGLWINHIPLQCLSILWQIVSE